MSSKKDSNTNASVSPSVASREGSSTTRFQDNVAYGAPQEASIDHRVSVDSSLTDGSLLQTAVEANNRLVPQPPPLVILVPNQDGEEKPKKEPPISWLALPRKDQLLILMIARLSEPLVQTSLQSYMFYQLRSFDPTLSDATISTQAGLLQAAFTATQFLTAMMWGAVADLEWVGRKRVLLIGLLGTAISAVGFGFSRSFAVAMAFRCMGGALNGNIGVMRTMISEIIAEKKYQSRAFLILPMTFNIGVIIGPILGGLLADPVTSYPSLFGPDSLFGGRNGVWWMMKWPYALPNLVSAVFLAISSCAVLFGLEETLASLRDTPDYGLRIGRYIYRKLIRSSASHDYAPVPTTPHDVELQRSSSEMDSASSKSHRPRIKGKLPLRRIWTPNVLFTLLSHGLLAMHIGTFNNLWFIFLSAPRFDPAHPIPPSHKKQSFPLHFTGGLGLPPPSIGLALSILGTIGITLQLTLYPTLSYKLGTIRSYRLFILLFPLVYLLTPYLALLPSAAKSPHPASGALVWAGIVVILSMQVLARTFALPATAILVNNCCPHPSVLGTIHGLGQSVSSATRTIGPIVGGWGLGQGLRTGVVGAAWWGLAGVSVIGVVAARFVREGSGHEILLEGEEEEEDIVEDEDRLREQEHQQRS